MTRISLLNKWLLKTPLPWSRALPWGVVAIAIPSLIRVAMARHVMWMDCCTPYFPFVLLSAVLLGWKRAALVAVIAAIMSDFLFVHSPYMVSGISYDMLHFTTFLSFSALIIALVHLVRRVAKDVLRLTVSGEPTSGIVFSTEAGQAWASWYGSSTPLRLGPQDDVAQMMRDFLANVELGKRLTGQTDESPPIRTRQC